MSLEEAKASTINFMASVHQAFLVSLASMPSRGSGYMVVAIPRDARYVGSPVKWTVGQQGA
jgi:hypothetical protein